MELFYVLGICILFVGIGIGISALIARRKKDHLRTILEARGAREISITWQSWNIDRSNYVYDVMYVDAEGKRHVTTCKVEAWGSRVFWADQP
jgi:Ca2+/Na+ antiporter